jgi:hypothetical protein
MSSIYSEAFVEATTNIIKLRTPAKYHNSDEFEYEYPTDKSARLILSVWAKDDTYRNRPPFQHKLSKRHHDLMLFIIDNMLGKKLDAPPPVLPESPVQIS